MGGGRWGGWVAGSGVGGWWLWGRHTCVFVCPFDDLTCIEILHWATDGISDVFRNISLNKKHNYMHVSMMSCNYVCAWIRYTFACVLSDNSHICDLFYAVLLFNWYRIYSLDGFNICQHVDINWCELRFCESSLTAINRMPLQFSVETIGLIVHDSTHRKCLNSRKWRSLDI